MAILLVEQYVDFASRLADHVFVMEQGSIVLEGKLDDMSDEDLKRLPGVLRRAAAPWEHFPSSNRHSGESRNPVTSDRVRGDVLSPA